MRRLSIFAVIAVAAQIAASGCGDSEPEPTTGAPAETPLTEDAFGRTWVFIDQLKMDHPFDAVVSTPFGFVALTHPPTLDGKAMPTWNNIAAVSADGLTWEENIVGADVHGRALASGNGVVVLVGRRFGEDMQRGVILVSSDGKSWEEMPPPPGNLYAVRFVRGKFWAFGERGTLLTSVDGRTWRDQSRSEYFLLNDVAYGNGRYVIVGNASWLSSSDGETWTQHRTICGDVARCPGAVPPGGTPPGTLALFSVVFGNGAFVTAGSDGAWVSGDGLTWTEAPGAVAGGKFAGGRFISLTPTANAVTVSDDGRAWANRTSFLVSDQPIGCAGRQCVAMDNGILVVPNAGETAPLARLPYLNIDQTSNHKTLPVMVGQRIWVSLQTIGPGHYDDPTVSSAAARFLDMRYSPLPNPGGPQQSYRFLTETPGRAEIHIPHSTTGEPFDLTLEISAR